MIARTMPKKRYLMAAFEKSKGSQTLKFEEKKFIKPKRERSLSLSCPLIVSLRQEESNNSVGAMYQRQGYLIV